MCFPTILLFFLSVPRIEVGACGVMAVMLFVMGVFTSGSLGCTVAEYCTTDEDSIEFEFTDDVLSIGLVRSPTSGTGIGVRALLFRVLFAKSNVHFYFRFKHRTHGFLYISAGSDGTHFCFRL